MILSAATARSLRVRRAMFPSLLANMLANNFQPYIWLTTANNDPLIGHFQGVQGDGI